MSESIIQQGDWEVDISRGAQRINDSTCVWSRNPLSETASAREWGWHAKQALKHPRRARVRAQWEVDFSKGEILQNRKRSVWARNLTSKTEALREWHRAYPPHLISLGIEWRIERPARTGRTINAGGYVALSRLAMTAEEILFAGSYNLISKNGICLEHRLRAFQKYGDLAKGKLVRHLDGIKSHNDSDNLVLGTNVENTADHNTARLLAMTWHTRYLVLTQRYNALVRKAGPVVQSEFAFESAALPDKGIFAEMPTLHLKK